MKRFTMQIDVGGGVVVLAAGSASAQTLKADIPFTFQVGDAVMAPGTYHVTISQNAGERHLVWRNADTNGRRWRNIRSARCGEAWRSRAARRWSGSSAPARVAPFANCGRAIDAPAYDFRGPRLGRIGETRIAEIGMSLLKAD